MDQITPAYASNLESLLVAVSSCYATDNNYDFHYLRVDYSKGKPVTLGLLTRYNTDPMDLKQLDPDRANIKLDGDLEIVLETDAIQTSLIPVLGRGVHHLSDVAYWLNFYQTSAEERWNSRWDLIKVGEGQLATLAVGAVALIFSSLATLYVDRQIDVPMIAGIAAPFITSSIAAALFGSGLWLAEYYTPQRSLNKMFKDLTNALMRAEAIPQILPISY